jgi:RNA polymerase sigma factor (sigma-70 family)
MHDERADGELIAATIADPEVFADLFDRHFGVIHRYLRRRVGGELADDLAAETFVEAFRVRHRFDRAKMSARPWLYGIAANLLRHHRREERRRLMAYARTGVDPVAEDEFEAADSRADAQALAPKLALALASLRGGDRDVLLLFVWEHLSYEQIAGALDVPVGTVRSRLHRARRRVRELLSDPGQYLVESDVARTTRGSTNG